jgi:hypothetical protein
MIALVRYPVLQEDEGRPQVIGLYSSPDKAYEIRDEWCRDGYFSERDFYTMEGVSEASN